MIHRFISLSIEFQIEGPKKTDVKFTIVCSGIRKKDCFAPSLVFLLWIVGLL